MMVCILVDSKITEDYYSGLVPHVDYFVMDTAFQSGSWTTFLDFDDSLKASVSESLGENCM